MFRGDTDWDGTKRFDNPSPVVERYESHIVSSATNRMETEKKPRKDRGAGKRSRMKDAGARPVVTLPGCHQGETTKIASRTYIARNDKELDNQFADLSVRRS